MQYEEFIYELIRLLMNWGVWKDSVKINYGRKIYSPGQMLKSTSDKFFDYVEYCKRKAIFEADKDKNTFRDLKNVVISEATETDIEFQSNWPERCEMSIELNSPLCDLFAFGAFSVDFDDLPLSRRIEAFHEREELQEKYREEYDEEEIRMNPEEYGIPSELEFDSSDDYEEFFEDELRRLEEKFIEDLSEKITFDNDLEADICELCIDYGLSYTGGDAYLFIGYDYF